MVNINDLIVLRFDDEEHWRAALEMIALKHHKAQIEDGGDLDILVPSGLASWAREELAGVHVIHDRKQAKRTARVEDGEPLIDDPDRLADWLRAVDEEDEQLRRQFGD